MSPRDKKKKRKLMPYPYLIKLTFDMLMSGCYNVWEMTSFLLECLHFPTLAHVSATVKRVIVLKGLMSVRADIRLRFIIAEENGGTGVACLSRVVTSVCFWKF